MSKKNARHIVVVSHEPDQPACQCWIREFGLGLKKNRHNIVHRDDPTANLLVTCREEKAEKGGVLVHRNIVKSIAGEVLARAVTLRTGHSHERHETFRALSGRQAAELVAFV